MGETDSFSPEAITPAEAQRAQRLGTKRDFGDFGGFRGTGSVSAEEGGGVGAVGFGAIGKAGELKPAGGDHSGHEGGGEAVVGEAKGFVGFDEDGVAFTSDAHIKAISDGGLAVGVDHGADGGGVGEVVGRALVARDVEDLGVEDVGAVFGEKFDGLAGVNRGLGIDICQTRIGEVPTDEAGEGLGIFDGFEENRKGARGDLAERTDLHFALEEVEEFARVANGLPGNPEPGEDAAGGFDSTDNGVFALPIPGIDLVHGKGNDFVSTLAKAFGGDGGGDRKGRAVFVLDEGRHAREGRKGRVRRQARWRRRLGRRADSADEWLRLCLPGHAVDLPFSDSASARAWWWRWRGSGRFSMW